jgi:hypothetical protein
MLILARKDGRYGVMGTQMSRPIFCVPLKSPFPGTGVAVEVQRLSLMRAARLLRDKGREEGRTRVRVDLMLTTTKEGVSCDMQAKTIEAKVGSVADNDHELATRMGGRVREKRTG